MKKLIILCFAVLAMVACGDIGGSHDNDGNNHNAYSMPDGGYYKETERYLDGARQQSGSYEPTYAWVDDQNQNVHYKNHDNGGYHHTQDNYNNHGGQHSNHHDSGYGHDCWRTSDDSYESVDVGDDNVEVRSIFTRISQAEYESVVANN